jgi:hypothetical protein
MKAILKGVLVVLVTLGLFAASVHAGTAKELRVLLGDKRTVFVGECDVNKLGFFSEAAAENTHTYDCVVGVNDKEPGEIYYVLFLNKKGEPFQVLRVDKTKGVTQERIWRNGVEV